MSYLIHALISLFIGLLVLLIGQVLFEGLEPWKFWFFLSALIFLVGRPIVLLLQKGEERREEQRPDEKIAMEKGDDSDRHFPSETEEE